MVSGLAAGPLLAGLLIGLGGALKLVPLALLAVVPLASGALAGSLDRLGQRAGGLLRRLSHRLSERPHHDRDLPAFVGVSVRVSTLYAWAEGLHWIAGVIGDVFDPAADMSLYQPRFPQGLMLAIFAAIGLALWIATWRRERPPQTTRSVAGFAALTYALLLLYNPAWNPQYALYLLPFLILLWPNLRGVFYALALTVVCLAEHPVYVNLIGLGQQPTLLLMIICARTALLVAIALDLGLALFRPLSRVRWVPLGLAGLSVLALVVAAPMFAQAYSAGRWVANPARTVTSYLNSLPDDEPVVTQQSGLFRQLRPFLDRDGRLQVAGGRPGRLDPLPGLLAAGPFRYVEAPGDGGDFLAFLDQSGRCPTRLPLDKWRIWVCNGAEDARRSPASPAGSAGDGPDSRSAAVRWAPAGDPVLVRRAAAGAGLHRIRARGRPGWADGGAVGSDRRRRVRLLPAAGSRAAWSQTNIASRFRPERGKARIGSTLGCTIQPPERDLTFPVQIP